MTTELELAQKDSRRAVAVAAPDPIDNLMRYSQAIEVAYDFADKLCRTALVPDRYRGKPADGAVAILYGAELGLNPIQALQQVFTVHGTPAIYARTMVALLKNRGYRIYTVDTSDDSVTVAGRSAKGEEEESTWTIQRASRAGYVPTIDGRTGKYKTNANGKLIGNEKYLTDPQAMLYAKAAAEVCRKLAPDVLLGIAYTVEDLESEPVRVESERADLLPSAPSASSVLDGINEHQAAEDPASKPSTKPENAQVADSAKSPHAAAEPDDASEPMSTRQQQERLRDLLNAAGVTEKADKHTYLSNQFGRKITGANQLTATEAAELIEYLEAPVEPDSVGEAVAMHPSEAEATNEHAIEAAEIVHAEFDQADAEAGTE
ncbi:hypothetical protein IU501_22945 [Nocardia otitidiscaviarum]|uniref:hypothetical protein n=1 Tax=Nocardia otitidiscaviarum TaxID=1823 RepID=UPI0006939881|nr:hypothetical protein [Nocardia otitidiscaviarum]MBF6135852.1 hypothetical protein [Nocardia otitidiscaviarum]